MWASVCSTQQRWRTEVARRRKPRPASPAITRASAVPRKRSLEVPLLWLGAAAFIGFPLLRDATSEPMQRNRYADRQSCECDYGPRCNLEGNAWLGPWYARNLGDRKADDPGAGECPSHTGGHGGYYGGYAQRSPDGYRPPVAIERGHRGGFGGTGRVRAAGS